MKFPNCRKEKALSDMRSFLTIASKVSEVAFFIFMQEHRIITFHNRGVDSFFNTGGQAVMWWV